METLSQSVGFLGVCVLGLPVWKANRAAKRLSAVEQSSAGSRDHPVFEKGLEGLKKRLEPDTWTRVDELTLILGYALTLTAHGLAIIS